MFGKYNNMHTERWKDVLIGDGIRQRIGLGRDHGNAGGGMRPANPAGAVIDQQAERIARRDELSRSGA
jgi:hypothetical protein